ncbi:carboxypeptidase-like regulatory domain-containing protein [Carboxylicivirga sp. RSCT41]|uniref:carboxypeptidase-like regulatory domain-containing protein n=1 Tax=Carboxylicivirga agarovorans TaxID=3417570 RepID=UPI003D353440
MKTLLFIFALLSIQLLSFSQVVSGFVLDQSNNAPICFATVYYNGTFAGTSSDEKGYFELKRYEGNVRPVTVSAIGYYSQTLELDEQSGSLLIRLQPKTYQLSGATVEAKSLERKRRRYLRLFRNEFLGTGYNAEHCKIVNEEDVTFNYNSDKDTIKAYALKPIVIENCALGYRVVYYLDTFEYYKKEQATFFAGNLKFEEDLSLGANDIETYQLRREDAYKGSRMHFFRVLWAEELEASLFKIRNEQNVFLTSEEVLKMDENHNRYFNYPGRLLIQYGGSRSIIEFIAAPVYFDETGFFNPGIKWSGRMALQRVADWLPYEYQDEQ